MWCCVLDLGGEAVPPEVRDRYRARVQNLAERDAIKEIDVGAFVGWVVPNRVPLRPIYARHGSHVAVGNVRLDHPDEVRRWSRIENETATSVELVLAAYKARGPRCLREVLGDFAVVIFDSRTQVLVAARDAFGVKSLFVGSRGRILTLSSELELVHDSEVLDDEFVADFLLGGDPGPERTIWSDSSAIPQGSVLTVSNGRSGVERYWTPHRFEPRESSDEKDVAEKEVAEFRALLTEAVRVRLTPGQQTWAELSGGLDSSSVVCLAQAHGCGRVDAELAGTVSIVDQLGTGDERRYAKFVLDRCGLRNETILDPWPWQDDGQPLPRTDEPRTHYPYFARDRTIGGGERYANRRPLKAGAN